MIHKELDHQSMLLAARIARELPERPEWIEAARANLRRWMARNADSPGLRRAYQEWLTLLEQPVDRICQAMLASTDEGQRLRQNSPFAGVLSPGEVWAIKRSARHEHRAA
ncbi:MAG: hypothetical protein HRU76_04700 [Phycisphaeraceae bacterium]|nr:hypothetical protein [Phycisphaerales bacterium]QOJ16928.1 MAG: hypothetical protein HRU76_04700 [Phycisphaeraceae bacterium]